MTAFFFNFITVRSIVIARRLILALTTLGFHIQIIYNHYSLSKILSEVNQRLSRIQRYPLQLSKWRFFVDTKISKLLGQKEFATADFFVETGLQHLILISAFLCLLADVISLHEQETVYTDAHCEVSQALSWLCGCAIRSKHNSSHSKLSTVVLEKH